MALCQSAREKLRGDGEKRGGDGGAKKEGDKVKGAVGRSMFYTKKLDVETEGTCAIVSIPCCPRSPCGAHRIEVLRLLTFLREVPIDRCFRQFQWIRLCMCGRGARPCEGIMKVIWEAPPRHLGPGRSAHSQGHGQRGGAGYGRFGKFDLL